MPKHRKILLVAGIALVASLGLLLYFVITKSQTRQFRVTFLDIGQGDATLIEFGNGKKMLVDCGKDRKILARLGTVLPFYDRTIDYVLATHPDLDHYGGCVDVLKNYTVKEIITNGNAKEYDPYWQEWDRAMKNEGAVIKIIDRPEVWVVASSTLEFLSPDPSLDLKVPADDSNNRSIVFRLKNGDSSFLFTADMEMPLEAALLNKYCLSTSTFSCPALEAHTLKVGHHGSDTSSGDDFLKAVQSKEAIISVGKNTYGHPSLRVMRKLERAQMEILRTDMLGDIIRY
ncbi:MAG: MBL fold metallo-hydrolase [Candidatus Magasanikbacteria bacterium]|nr:MBL fold metallo-hydrolase [Candidatus Magasanikbacteria bacterium]